MSVGWRTGHLKLERLWKEAVVANLEAQCAKLRAGTAEILSDDDVLDL
jgi:hypothetical protein